MARDTVKEDANWAHALHLLRGNNDNSRLAGLLLVTKCVAPTDDAKREEVFRAVGGVDFLLRLLLPLRQGRMHPNPSLSQEEVDRQVQLAALGLSIVSNLCSSEAVARETGMGRVVEIATNVMRFGPGRLIGQYVGQDETGLDMDVKYGMVRDACDCAYLLADEIEARAVEGCVECVAACQAPITEKEETFSTCLRSVLRCCLKVQGGFIREVVAKLFAIDTGVEQPPVSLQCAFEVLSFLDRAAGQGLLDGVANVDAGDTPGEASTASFIRGGLRCILATRPPEVPRYQTLRVSSVIAAQSIEWLVEDLEFFELLVQTARVEIGVLMLDAVQPDAILSDLRFLEIKEGGDIVNKDNPPFGRLAKDRALENLPVCFQLFELFVDGLCDASAVEEFDASPAIGRIFEALTESAELMLQYVELGNDENGDSDEMGVTDHIECRKLLKLGAFRGFCSYASQNPLQFQDRLFKVLELEEFPVCLALPALYGIAVVHGRPIIEPAVVLQLMDEALLISENSGHSGNDMDRTAATEVLFEVLLHALSADTERTDASVLRRIKTYPQEFDCKRALEMSSSEEEKVIAVAVAARCFLLCPEHQTLLRQLVQTCVPDIIEELFSVTGDSDEEIDTSPLVQEMFHALLAACVASADIASLELAGNTLLDLCRMFESV